MRRLLRTLLPAALLSVPVQAWAQDGAPPPPPELVQPVLKNQTEIEYPAELLEREDPPSGRVMVRFVVGVDGVPTELEIEQGVDPILDAAALAAVGELRYSPGTYNGDPVEIVMRIALDLAPPSPPTTQDGSAATEEGDDEETSSPEEPAAPPPLRLTGTLRRAGDRTAIDGASVLVIPAPADARVGHVRKRDYGAQATPLWEVGVRSNADGRFEVAGEFSGKVRVVILAQGFERIEYIENVAEDEALEVNYYATPLNVDPYRTVVRAERNREEVARRTIDATEINALPGNGGDAIKSLQNFPGMVRAPFSAGLVLIRGAAPSDSAVYMAHHEIPQIFHFGGLSSIFNSDILETIDFIPGNFDSRYGDAIGGIIDVRPRKGRRDGYHGYVDSDLLDTGVLFEGPVGDGSIVLSGRRSYIDLILPAVIPPDAGLDFAIAPRYYDYQAMFDHPLWGGNLSVRAFGSDDRTKLVTAGANDVETDDRNRFESTVLFHRADLAWEKNTTRWDFLIAPSYRRDLFDIAGGSIFRAKVVSDAFMGRAEATRHLSKRDWIRVGYESIASRVGFQAEAPPIPTTDGSKNGERIGTDREFPVSLQTLYTTASYGVGDNVYLYPGVRASWAAFQGIDRVSVDPRFRFAWNASDTVTVKGGSGLYSQVGQPPELDPLWGNPRIRQQRAFQNSLGIAKTLPYDVTVDATGFFNYQFDLVSNSIHTVRRTDGVIGPEVFSSEGTGRAYGLEFLLRKNLTDRFFGWVAYTLMRAERRFENDVDYNVVDFDQTHNLTLLGVYKLPRQWQVGARFRLTSGNPSTPVVGAQFDASTGSYDPLLGPHNSGRVPAFHQLDIRVDKKWIWRKLSLNIYLDIQNVYNRQNPEFETWNFDFTEQSFIPGLPIIPSLGVKVEF